MAPLRTALAGTGAAGCASGNQKCRLRAPIRKTCSVLRRLSFRFGRVPHVSDGEGQKCNRQNEFQHDGAERGQ